MSQSDPECFPGDQEEMGELANHLHVFYVPACRQINQARRLPSAVLAGPQKSPCLEIFGTFFSSHSFLPYFSYFQLQLHLVR